MQRTARTPKRTTPGMMGAKVLIALSLSIVMLAGGGLSVYGSEGSGTGPDTTGLDLDRYGADIAPESAPEFGASPDITTLNLDQYGADIMQAPDAAAFQIHGEPDVVFWVAGPHDVAGGNEGPSVGAGATGN